MLLKHMHARTHTKHRLEQQVGNKKYLAGLGEVADIVGAGMSQSESQVGLQ